MSKVTRVSTTNRNEETKNELEEVNFQFFRIKYALKQYRERCEALGINPNARTDELLEQLAELMKRKELLQKK